MPGGRAGRKRSTPGHRRWKAKDPEPTSRRFRKKSTMPRANCPTPDDPSALRCILRRPLALGLAYLALSIALSACGAKRIALPTDPGAPFPDFATVHAELSRVCGGVRTLTAELSL